MTNPNFSKLSNGQIDRLISHDFYGMDYNMVRYADYMLNAWQLHYKLIDGGTQRLTVHVRGKYYSYHCAHKGIIGEAIEETAERAICIAILRAYKIIPGWKSIIDGSKG